MIMIMILLLKTIYLYAHSSFLVFRFDLNRSDPLVQNGEYSTSIAKSASSSLYRRRFGLFIHFLVVVVVVYFDLI